MTGVEPERRKKALDCVVRLVTPERIVLDYPLAGPFRRFCTYLIDQILIVVLVLATVVVSKLAAMGSIAAGAPLVGYFALTWGYGGFFEGLLNGQTLGKHQTGIRVLSEMGLPISGVQANCAAWLVQSMASCRFAF